MSRELSPRALLPLSVVLALVAALLFTPVGGYAQGLLSVFRADQVQAVQQFVAYVRLQHGGRVTNVPEANKYLRKDYTAGWNLNG